MSSLHPCFPSASAELFSFAPNKKSDTHGCNASRPPPARNWVCSDSGNEWKIAARSSAHTLRC